jgi:tetratricopeptide (TPR) repeat protein
MAKRWQQKEVTYLKRYAKIRRLSELAERFRTKPAEVEQKLIQLGLASRDGFGFVARQDDPLVQVYERGVKAVHRKKWRQAVKYFEQVISESDEADLVGQARRFARVCARHLQKESGRQGEDPFLRAVYERNRGNLEEALSICSRGGRQSKDERFAYLAASVHSLKGDLEAATRLLKLAIEINPKNRVHAFHDPDFEALRNDPQLKEIFF